MIRIEVKPRQDAESIVLKVTYRTGKTKTEQIR